LAWQQCLYFRPLPHGQASLRPTFVLAMAAALVLITPLHPLFYDLQLYPADSKRSRRLCRLARRESCGGLQIRGSSPHPPIPASTLSPTLDAGGRGKPRFFLHYEEEDSSAKVIAHD